MSTIFSIEGNIGCGKTTLLRILEKELPTVVFMNEPVSEWESVGNGTVNLLNLYYSDPERWGLTFQTYALFTRIKKWHYNKHMDNQLKISQRSIEADKEIFASAMKDQNYLNEDEYAMYQDYYSSAPNLGQMRPLQGVIYLKCDPKVCQERINKRNRLGESLISMDYLELLDKKHEEWLGKRDNVLTIDTSMSFQENEDLKNEIVAKIKNHLGRYLIE